MELSYGRQSQKRKTCRVLFVIPSQSSLEDEATSPHAGNSQLLRSMYVNSKSLPIKQDSKIQTQEEILVQNRSDSQLKSVQVNLYNKYRTLPVIKQSSSSKTFTNTLKQIQTNKDQEVDQNEEKQKEIKQKISILNRKQKECQKMKESLQMKKNPSKVCDDIQMKQIQRNKYIAELDQQEKQIQQEIHQEITRMKQKNTSEDHISRQKSSISNKIFNYLLSQIATSNYGMKIIYKSVHIITFMMLILSCWYNLRQINLR